MATRMQQRRGTAAQWTAANPILAAGEIGFETDTNKFKMGNGSSAWSALQYFANAAELAAIIDGAPDLLNTLNELAEAIGEDPTFFTTVASNLSAHSSDTTSVHGIANTALLATLQNVDDKIATATDDLEQYVGGQITLHNNDTTGVHGIADTSLLATTEDVLTHTNANTDVHGIADTSLLATTGDITAHAAVSTSVHGVADMTALATTADTALAIAEAVGDHADLTLNAHGISDTANLVYTADLNAHTNATTGVHGIADVSDIVLSADLSAHTNATTGVHGIADTADLVTTEMLTDALTPSSLGYATLAGVGLTYDAVNDQIDIDSTVATKQYADDAISTHSADSTNVHGIANTADLATKSYVDTAESDAIDAAAVASENYTDAAILALTKSSVGLSNVDNTSDANKPVSTATQTALDLKANISSPTLTGTTTTADLVVNGDFTVNGTNFSASATSITIEDNMVQLAHQNSGNSVDLGLVVAYNDGSAKHSGLVRDVSDAKWKLFKGVTTEPSTTVDFTQGSLDDLAVAGLTATTVTPSSGVVFTDGTQTKEGVVSRTPIVQKTAAYTLSALTERDSLIEISSASAVTLSIPTDATLNFPIGTSIDILQTGAGQVTIAAATPATTTVNATPGLKLRTTWSSATLFKRAANTWVVYGDLTA